MTEHQKRTLDLNKTPIQCHNCGIQIGKEELGKDCSSCGFSNEESLVQYFVEFENQ